MNAKVSLTIVSFLTLFYELVFIRWLPANVTSLAYFTNFVLISTFLGLGLGYLIPSHRRDLFPWFPAILLAVVCGILLLRNMGILIPTNSSEWIWSSRAENVVRTPSFSIPMIPAIVGIFILNVVIFVPLGQKTRTLLEQLPTLAGYSVTILGSIVGVISFSLFSVYYRHSQIPVSWFVMGGLLVLPLMAGWRQRAAAGVATALLWAVVAWGAYGEVWSPYYLIQVKSQQDNGFSVFVNKFFHQMAVNFGNDQIAAAKYSFTYALTVPRRLLVLGAGTGNDVAMALRYGVAEIDAVEIDPEILNIGRSRHPQSPYSDPRVRVVIDDARSFLRRTKKQYDMVILGTLDSHALLSGMSTMRLDNYVYTQECLEDIARRLVPEKGVVMLLYSVSHGWLGEKLEQMAAAVFPGTSYVTYSKDDNLFNLMIAAGPGMPHLVSRNPTTANRFGPLPPFDALNSDIPSDDWPYLYLAKRRIPAHYLAVIAILVGLTVVSVIAVTGGRPLGFSPTFFFTGCAFMLLETKSVTTLSLLYGSTWSVNAAVFIAIMVMILLANMTVTRGAFLNLRMIGACLFASLALNWAVPPNVFLHQASVVKWLVPSLLIALPIYFAGILFARLLSSASDIRTIYSSNLIGCVLGGFVEYVSMITGLRFLFVLVALFYALALVAVPRRTLSAG